MRDKPWRGIIGLVTSVVLAAGCAGGTRDSTEMSLILDFVPGGIHAGIYSALGEGYFEERGLEVEIQPPTSSADTLRLVVAGQAAVGIAPVGDVAALRAAGEPVRIFMALEQVPLVALISTEAIGVAEPSDLRGGTVGVTGVPSDEVIARFILASGGVAADEVDFITIGFDAVGNLIGRTVDAAVGFWSAEAVALRLEDEEPVVFRPEDYGAPPFPELVFFSAEETVAERPEALADFAAAVTDGYRFALEHPDAAISHLADNADGVDEGFAGAEFDAVGPHFLDADGNFGTIDEGSFSEYLDWAADVGIIESVPEDLLAPSLMP